MPPEAQRGCRTGPASLAASWRPVGGDMDVDRTAHAGSRAIATGMSRRAARTLRALGACAVVAGCLVPLESPAVAQQINTFTGQCSGVPVHVTYVTPLKLYPQTVSYTGILNGGSCT